MHENIGMIFANDKQAQQPYSYLIHDSYANELDPSP